VAPRINLSVWSSLRDKGERIWLFDPPLVSMNNPAVKKYIRLGRSGACDIGHKVQNRSPWYRVPLPYRVHGFMSGMSSNGPWISFRELRRLTATNTLYIVGFPPEWSANARAAVALGLLTSKTREELYYRGRKYADGLTKFELGDLREV